MQPECGHPMLDVGDKLGPYEVLAPLGEGGMGQVWKARDTRLDRIVALKISKREFTQRFEREARAILRVESSAHLPALRCWPELPSDGIRRGRAAPFSKKAGFAPGGKSA